MNVNPRIVAGSLAGILAIAGAVAAKYEGLSLGSYYDPVSVLTACRGHTGKDVKPNTVYTLAQCEQWFDQDLKEAYTAVKQCTRVSINDNEAASYTSLTFNIGTTAFCHSTLVQKLNKGDHKGACDELLKWVHAGGRVLNGLVKRRAEEHTLCLTPSG